MSGRGSIQIAHWLKTILVALGILCAFVVVFGAGFWLGRTSETSFSSVAPYARNPTRSGHGATGIIQEISDQKIVLRTRDGATQVILVNGETRFDKGFKQVSQSDLKVNDRIIVLGSPNAQGEIVARLVGLVDSDSPRLPHGLPSPATH